MAENEKLRLFLGSFVELKGINKKNLHLTWKFFGETEPVEIPQMLDHIEKITSEISEISINFNRVELWPNLKYPRLMVIAGDDMNGNATKLYTAFNQEKFKPHITVARFKNKQPPESPVFQPKTINFNEIALIKSTLSSKGSVYEVYKSWIVD